MTMAMTTHAEDVVTPVPTPDHDARTRPESEPAAADVSIHDLDLVYRQNFMRQIMEISQAMNARLMELNALSGHEGLKMSYATVMAYAGFGTARISDVAQRHGLSKQAVSQVAGELAQLGYIRLVRDPEDGRARSIQLTPKGQKMISASLQSIETVREEMAGIIGADRFAALETLVEDLWRGLSDREGPATPLKGSLQAQG